VSPPAHATAPLVSLTYKLNVKDGIGVGVGVAQATISVILPFSTEGTAF
jgi:hypothetical protein